jgi:ubiquinone/menaquinone biosynthesis C-methylase UbiE
VTVDNPLAAIADVFDRAAASYGQTRHDFFRPVGSQLVADLDPARGSRALDAGCGRGAVLFPLAERVGSAGSVVGIDLAPAMVQLTRDDAARRGLTNVTVQVMDAQQPELPAGVFDVVASSLVLFFLPDPAAALRAWHRLLAPGGQLGITTFGDGDRRWEWLEGIFSPYNPRPKDNKEEAPGPFSSVERLEELVAKSGFTEARTIVREHRLSFGQPHDWVKWSWSHGMRQWWEWVPQAERGDVEEQVVDRLQGMQAEPDALSLQLVVRYTLAAAR